MFVRRTTTAVSITVAAALLLAGCSEDPAPRFEPRESPTPTSSSASPEAQSPEQFIREWFELNTEMQNTGDTTAFRAASKDCATCNDIADQVEEIYGAGGEIRVPRQTILQVKRGAHSRTIQQFSVTVRTAPTVYTETAGAKSKRLEGGKATYTVTVVLHDQDQWRMEAVQVA